MSAMDDLVELSALEEHGTSTFSHWRTSAGKMTILWGARFGTMENNASTHPLELCDEPRLVWAAFCLASTAS